MQILADEMHIKFLQRLGIGKLRKSTTGNIAGLKDTRMYPPQSGAQWSERVLIFFHRGDGRRYLQRLLRHPIGVMRTKSFTIRKADEPGAVIDLLRKLLGWLCCFYLRQQGKPSAESIAVGGVIEPQKVGSAIGEAIGGLRFLVGNRILCRKMYPIGL